MKVSLRRQYLAMTSTRPSEWLVRWVIKDRRYVSKFLDGGKVTRKTQRSCHPLNTLSLDRREISTFRHLEDRIVTYVLEFPMSCFTTWQYISSLSSPWVRASLNSQRSSSRTPRELTKEDVDAFKFVLPDEPSESALVAVRSRSRSPIIRWMTLNARTAFLWRSLFRERRGALRRFYKRSVRKRRLRF